MRIAISIAVAIAAAGCDDGSGGDGDGLDFDVDLVDSCPVVDPFYFGVASVEVQLRGEDGGSPCTAARRCLQVPFTGGDPWDPEMIESVLRSAAQPLLATERAASDFKIIGSQQSDCSFGGSGTDVFLCGVAPLSSISGGVLEIPVDCTPSATDLPACPVEPLPDCP